MCDGGRGRAVPVASCHVLAVAVCIPHALSGSALLLAREEFQRTASHFGDLEK